MDSKDPDGKCCEGINSVVAPLYFVTADRAQSKCWYTTATTSGCPQNGSVAVAWLQALDGPAMDEPHQWASEQIDQRLVEPNSVLGKAITYLQRHWEPLTLFLRQPGAPNTGERALKKAILHRKNSKFYKTRIGARLGDLFMSIFYTCQFKKINPLHYMNTGCGQHAEVGNHPEQWLPWNYHLAVLAIS
ncbi:MAG: transposase [Verrucomicrobiota bacterium]|nr:transposase [Verrucomicrobiota bacterium]